MVILETERLIFRHHEEADREPYCRMMADPVFRRLSGGPPLPRKEAERSFGNVLRWRGTMGLFATVYRPDSRYIGRCGLYPIRDEEGAEVPGEAYLAHYLARPYWGRGLATEAGRAFIAWGFERMGLSRIEAGVAADNPASMRVIEKLGLVRFRSGEGNGNAWHDYEIRNPAPRGPGN